MGTLRFFEEVVSFKIRRTFGFADYRNYGALRATMIYLLSKLFRIFDCAEATFARQCPNKFDIALTYSYLCMI